MQPWEYSYYLRSTVTQYVKQEASPYWRMNLVEIPTGIVYWDLSTPYVTRPCMFKKKKKKKKIAVAFGNSGREGEKNPCPNEF